MLITDLDTGVSTVSSFPRLRYGDATLRVIESAIVVNGDIVTVWFFVLLGRNKSQTSDIKN